MVTICDLRVVSKRVLDFVPKGPPQGLHIRMKEEKKDISHKLPFDDSFREHGRENQVLLIVDFQVVGLSDLISIRGSYHIQAVIPSCWLLRIGTTNAIVRVSECRFSVESL